MTTITDANIKGYVDAYFNLHNDDKGNTLAFGRKKIISGLPSDLKNKKIGDWDVSNVTNMRELFKDRELFNDDISGWNVSQVTDMSYMFLNAAAFNQDIGQWNVGNVTNMGYMFYRATAFNQPLANWKRTN